MTFFLLGTISGTPQYMPPEYSQSKKYDGCQGTVWQMGILLVDMLSPQVPAFKHSHLALSMPPRVPQNISAGILFTEPSDSWYLKTNFDIWAKSSYQTVTASFVVRKKSEKEWSTESVFGGSFSRKVKSPVRVKPLCRLWGEGVGGRLCTEKRTALDYVVC